MDSPATAENIRLLCEDAILGKVSWLFWEPMENSEMYG